jgi:hypothetical protein
MAARVVCLAAARRRRRHPRQPAASPGVPYVLQSHPGCVSLIFPELELWLAPEDAEKLLAELPAAIAAARRASGG